MWDFKKQINEYLQLEIDTLKKINVESINEVMNILEQTRINRKRIYICGNGGSAATASHFLCDFNKGVSENINPKYEFVCLNDNIPFLMAAANDYSYEDVFSIQIMDRITSEDILLVISGSGNSKNILNAIEYAKTEGAKVIALTGYEGGKAMALSDFNLHVPINNMQITEDIHLIFNHILMWVLKTDH